nr:MAG TPA: hypothetical protein [Caudoviricetes sp.]
MYTNKFGHQSLFLLIFFFLSLILYIIPSKSYWRGYNLSNMFVH